MEVIKTAKAFMLFGLGLMGGGLIAWSVIQPKTAEGKEALAHAVGYTSGFATATFGMGLGALVGCAEELATKAAEEIV